MRYIIVPDDVQLRDPVTDQPGDKITWSEAIRVLFSEPRFVQVLDVFTAMDLRKKLMRGAKGDVVELGDNEWSVLADIARTPKMLAPVFVYSAEHFFRAITDAPNADPRPPVVIAAE